jgi:acetyltransferase
MKELFYPESVIIFGVSPKPDNMAKDVLNNLIRFGFKGKIYCMGREAGQVSGYPVLTDISSIPAPVDVATVLAPAMIVPFIVDMCGKLKVKYLHIASGGFEELSAGGKNLQEQVLSKARAYGIRIIGPNCLGVANVENAFSTPFGKLRRMRAGGVSLISQSGGVGFSLIQRFDAEQIGINKFISFGNKMDLDETDFLEYLGTDPGTKIICAYLEDFKRGRAFFEAARRINKPVILQKNNRYETSLRIARSHTAAMASNNTVMESAARQSNVLLAKDFSETINLCKMMTLPPIKGNNLAVISRSGGHAVIAADACAEYCFNLPEFTADIIEEIRKGFRAGVVAPQNPLDMSDIFHLDKYLNIIEKIYGSDLFDAMLLMITSMSLNKGELDPEGDVAIINKIIDLQKNRGKPILFIPLYFKDQLDEVRKMVFYPMFENFEEAVSVLARARNYNKARICRRKETHESTSEAFEKSVSSLLNSGNFIFNYNEIASVFGSEGIPVLGGITLKSSKEIPQHEKNYKFPAVLKILSEKFTHKSDIGGVVTGIRDFSELQEQTEILEQKIISLDPAAPYRLLIQEEKTGLEMIVGARKDPDFGALIMVGAGGKYVEILNDISSRLAPVSEQEALEMIESLKIYKILSGVRGEKPRDIKALSTIVVRLSNVIAACDISEIDLNPVMVFDQGAVAVDLRIQA